MKKYFHGIDLHKRYVTVNVRNEKGVEIQHISHCSDFQEYINTLTSKDSVVIESINNAFYWAGHKSSICCSPMHPWLTGLKKLAQHALLLILTGLKLLRIPGTRQIKEMLQTYQ